jgi:hypothetical protein
MHRLFQQESLSYLKLEVMLFKSFKYSVIITLCFCFVELNAQHVKWHKIYGGNDNEQHIASTTSGDSMHIFNIGRSGSITNGTSVMLDSFCLKSSANHIQYIYKVDTSGTVIWAKALLFGHLAKHLASDSKSNMYAIVEITPDSIGKGDSIQFLPNSKKVVWEGQQSPFFLISLNTYGELRLIKHLETGSSNLLAIDNDELYLIHDGDRIMGGTYYPKGKVLTKLDSNGLTIYHRSICENTIKSEQKSAFVSSNGDIVFNEKSVNTILYLGDSLIINGKPTFFPFEKEELNPNRFKFTSPVLVSLSKKTGKVEWYKYLLEDSATSNKTPHFNIQGMEYIGNGIIGLTGFFSGNLNFINIDSNTTSTSGLLVSSFYAFLKDGEPYFASTIGKHKSMFGNMNVSGAKDGFFFFGGDIQTGDLIHDHYDLPEELGRQLYSKVDTLGNIMWLFRIGKGNNLLHFSSNYGFDKYGGIYLPSQVEEKYHLNGQSYEPKGVDLAITKIFDYSITRGEVHSGPYCAGDSIYIPFSSVGQFDSANTFTAQLSNAQGNFDRNVSELGKLKSFRNNESIYGVIPRLDVATSDKYRIRIISSHPEVSSYYKLDKLRMLIYSMDTAYAGEDTAICFGSKLDLATTGGSQWQWSPFESFDNPNLRNPEFIDSVTRRVSVIISDSSGCGVIDTAYKNIVVLEPLKILNIDQTVCRGDSFTIEMKARGGNGNYQYNWFDSTNSLMANNILLKSIVNAPTEINMILSDNCSRSFRKSITISPSDELGYSTLDSNAFCDGDSVDIQLEVIGGVGKKYVFWENPIGQMVSVSAIKMFVNRKSLYPFYLIDDCGITDKLWYKPKIHENPKLMAPKDTVLCYGSKYYNEVVVNGGKKPISYNWVSNTTRGDSRLINLVAFSSDTILMSCTDACDNSTSDSMNFVVIPPPRIYVEDSIFCPNEDAQVFIKALEGKDSKIKLFDTKWNLIYESNNEVQYEAKSNESIYIVAFDDCSSIADTLLYSPDFHPYKPLKILISPDQPSMHDTVHFRVNIENTSSIKWSYSIPVHSIPITHDSSLTLYAFDYDLNHNRWHISVLVEDSNGCVYNESQYLEMDISIPVFIPNAFSPNGDGVNDQFLPQGSAVKEFRIKIYDRRHFHIFKGQVNEVWTGKETERIDSFLYMIDVTTTRGEKKQYFGVVNKLN